MTALNPSAANRLRCAFIVPDLPSNTFRHIAAVCAAQALAIAASILSPLAVGSLIIGLGIGEVEAGALITAELLVLGATSILVAPLGVRIPYRILALAGGVMIISGQAGAATATGLNDLYPWRLLAGAGCGCLLATVNAAIARARNPDLLYGLAWAAAYSFSSVMAIAITESNTLVTYEVVYGSLAVAQLLLLPLLWFIPEHGKTRASLSLPAGSIGTGCILMAGIALMGVSVMVYYAFLERLAVQIGAAPAETGRIVAAAQVAGIVGGLLAAPVARKFGLAAGLCTTTILHAVAISLAVWTGSVLTLGIVAFVEAVLFIMMIPLMLTLAAGIDEKGRWAAVAGGVFVLSTALGPVLGALLIEWSGYDAIAWAQWPAALLAVAIFSWVSRNRG